MNAKRCSRLMSASLILVLASVACATAAPVPTETQPPPPTAVPPTATNTAVPTATPRPTSTPNLAATKAADEFKARLQGYVDKGYLSKAEGERSELDNYSIEWAQINYLSNPESTGFDVPVKDFVFMADVAWESAVQFPEASGCGLYFREQPNGDFYSVYLDFDRVVMGGHVASMGPYVTRFGITQGTGRVKFKSPANAAFTLIMEGYKAYVLVNEEFVGSYTLYADKLLSPGYLDYFIKSGSNKDFGTRCQITNAVLWVPVQE